MRASIHKYRMRLASAAVTLAIGSVGISLLHAQVIRCYTEVCVPTTGGGESCYVKEIPCPKDT